MEWTEIPKIGFEDAGPGWIPREFNGKRIRPLIKCQCGHIGHISLHHVHADGTVTASYFHDKAPHPDIGYPGGGCGWHVFLRLLNYSEGDFPPQA